MRGNIAERAARWSAAHWKTATFGWLAFVAVAVVLGQAAGTVHLSDVEDSNGEPARAEQALLDAGFHNHAGEAVLVKSSSRTVADPAFRAELERVEARSAPSPRHGSERAARARRSDLGRPARRDRAVRHARLARNGLLAGRARARARRRACSARRPASPITEFGDASAQHELDKSTGHDFSRAESLTLPVTFLVLLLAFGAFVAAGVPVLLSFSAVLGSLGLAALLSHLVHASEATNSVMLLIGMAVGVDYSLFYLKREREERRGASPEEALARAAATSGRAVLISGTTVLIAMAGMLMAGSKIFSSFGDRRDGRRARDDDRLADRAARAARQARRPGRSRRRRGARREPARACCARARCAALGQPRTLVGCATGAR